MPSASTNLLCLPVELLEMITLHLEYAYEVDSLSQTCRRLYTIANHCLFRYYAKECSPLGLERVVKNNNLQALKALLQHGFDFDQYFRITSHPSPIFLTVDKDLSSMAELLLAHSDLWGGPPSDYRKRDICLEKALLDAASKGSLGVTKVLTSPSTGVTKRQMARALEHAVKQDQLAVARYLIEERAVDVNEQIIRYRYLRQELSESFLTMAAYCGNLQMVELLVKAGADLNHPSFQRIVKCPLHVAAARNHATVERYLIENGMRFHASFSDVCDVEECSGRDYTPSNFFKGVDLSAIIPHECSHVWRRRTHRLIAACNDLPACQRAWNMWNDLDNLEESFEVALMSGSWTVVRYIVDAIIELEGRNWMTSCLTSLLIYTMWNQCDHSLPAFNMMLDLVPLPDQPADRKELLNEILNQAQRHNCPAHIEALIQRGYLDEMEEIVVVTPLLHFAFEAGSLGTVWHVLKHYTRPLDVLDIAARCSSLETFCEFLSTQNITLDPNEPIHCSALVNAAVYSNIDVVGYFLGKGFDINASYNACISYTNTQTGALIIYAAANWRNFDEDDRAGTDEKRTATIQFLLDHGAQINARSAQGQTALSLAFDSRYSHLVNILFNRGADPLVGLESRTNLSALEQVIRTCLQDYYQIYELSALQSCLKAMSAKGYKSDDFLSLMPRFEGTLSHPMVTSQFERHPGIGPMADKEEDKLYVRWSHFFLIRELRRHYWRAMYPVASE